LNINYIPLTTASYQIELFGPIVTFPITDAEGAIKEHLSAGETPRNFIFLVDGCTIKFNI
jgi:hypothetical protein